VDNILQKLGLVDNLLKLCCQFHCLAKDNSLDIARMLHYMNVTVVLVMELLVQIPSNLSTAGTEESGCCQEVAVMGV